MHETISVSEQGFYTCGDKMGVAVGNCYGMNWIESVKYVQGYVVEGVKGLLHVFYTEYTGILLIKDVLSVIESANLCRRQNLQQK